MRSLQDISIQRKQMVIIMLTSGIALLLACIGFVTSEMINFRRELTEEMSTIAQVVGNNCTAALDFNEPKSAEESLKALRAETTVVAACVYDRQGKEFAVYRRDSADKSELPEVQP